MSKIETKTSTICLNMIVKNEAHILERCLKSVIPHIDTWVISDTGSTDGTQELIRKVMQDIPGDLIEHEWQNFGHNRNQVLQASKGKADYILTIDADEWLEAEADFDFSNLRADSYYIIKDQNKKRYWVRNIVKNDMGWCWNGVLHEYLKCKNAQSYGEVQDAVIQARQEGARAHDPKTYRKDAAILTEALIDEPENTRYQFYLAQSWRDANEYELAITNYERRIEMGGWEEEIFYSKYQIAALMKIKGKTWEKCMAAYLKAWEYTPERAEPLYKIGAHYLQEENWPLAWLFLNQAANLKKPEKLLLFIEDAVYDFMALLDASLAAGHLGYTEEMQALHKKLQTTKDLPERVHEIIKQNQAHFEGLMNEADERAA